MPQIRPFNLLSRLLRRKHAKAWILICASLLGAVLIVQKNAFYWKASILEIKEHASFDGLAYPVQQVPDYLNTTREDQEIEFTLFPPEKLEAIPKYVPSILKTETDNLPWNDPEANKIRQAKITYPVVYAGTYEMDGEEDKGSHPGVDIKALLKTPVFAIANGVVEKVAYSNSGFGNHIVLRHQDFPSLDNPNIKETLYSGYSHLSEILVSENQVVEKGQMIGKMGKTGIATTNHLHFQIDNSLAPWHPYWPFTWAEASAAGYSFTEAVDNGLGKERVYEYTVNPLKYVQTYYSEIKPELLKMAAEESQPGEEIDQENPAEIAEEAKETEIVSESTDAATNISVYVDFAEIEFRSEEYVLVGNTNNIYLTLKNSAGEKVLSPAFTAQIEVSLSNDLGEVDPKILTAKDFKNGQAVVNFKTQVLGTTKVLFLIGNQTFETGEIGVIEQVTPIAQFAVVHDGSFIMGVPEKIKIICLDENGNQTPAANFSGIVVLSTTKGQGFFTPSSLTKEDFEAGLVEVEFTGTSDEDVIIKAKEGALVGASTVFKPHLFTDVDSTHLNYQAIRYLKTHNVIRGYPDFSFQPEKPVSRVEALKLIFEGLGKQVVTGVNLKFKDTESNTWYSNYVATAQKLNIVNGYPDGTFKPTQEVNRVELLKMILNALEAEVDPLVIKNLYDDVHRLEWFAPYVQYAEEKNLISVTDSKFYPASPMTRAEVAEAIYRILVLQKTGAESYRSNLVIE